MALTTTLIIIAAFLVIVYAGKYRAVFHVRAAAKKIPKKLSDKEFVKACYDLITRRFRSGNLTWVKYPLRDFYIGNIWGMKGKALPCHVQNTLFRHALYLRFSRRDVKDVWIWELGERMIHNFSQVKVGGKWISVDPWGREWLIPYGKNMLDVGFKR